ncbi:DUF3073 domain-containing protein [Streptosporangium sandarakinum]|uniref:DUF3073 domain-containing protein n=1 Tax=Streptosporangium sandarakinum TaxID=1260955 RepID=UPI003425C5B0
MGRGRAKAKQAKVARELKYGNHGVDLDRLREELVAAGGSRTESQAEDTADDYFADR